MRRAGGYAVASRDGKVLKECDTFTCAHCNRIVFVRPKEDAANLGGMCKPCNKLVCPRCNATGKCEPFEKKLLEMESRDRFLRSVG